VLNALAEQPGGEAVLELAKRREDLMLVGGAVRDLLLGRKPLELDVTVADRAAEAAVDLASQLAGPTPAQTPQISIFERFGTACVEWEGGRIDIAQRRNETYPEPGALPVVEPGGLKADLTRRDFTLNAIALTLSGEEAGRLHAVEHGLEDLEAGRLRVLHERSFLDDPTRLLRLARYSGRLGLVVETTTGELARSALADGALDTVSRARIGAELWLAVSQEMPLRSLAALEELDLLSTLGLPASFDSSLAQAALDLMPLDGSIAELLMGVLLHPLGEVDDPQAAELLNEFEVPADIRQRVLASAFTAESMATNLQPDMRPSALRLLFHRVPVEAVSLTGALAQRRSPEILPLIEQWLGELRHVRLRIGGENLLAAGIAQGPDVGRRLTRALDMKLDGEIPDSAEAELRAALASTP
jgi:tRNA nucleotidyltransferase (CCA-adding enzyme)